MSSIPIDLRPENPDKQNPEEPLPPLEVKVVNQPKEKPKEEPKLVHEYEDMRITDKEIEEFEKERNDKNS